MRWFAWCLMAVAGFTIGCNQPVETIPSVAPESSSGVTMSDEGSGTTMGGDHEEGHEGDHEGHDHGADAKAEVSDGETTADGDAPAVNEVPAGDTGPEDSPVEPSASKGDAELIRFVADKKISVPSMMCPYSCWPKVKETLASQPGVEAVQLAEQPASAAEGEIVERVVELKLNGDFDADAAVAALAKVNFEAQIAN